MAARVSGDPRVRDTRSVATRRGRDGDLRPRPSTQRRRHPVRRKLSGVPRGACRDAARVAPTVCRESRRRARAVQAVSRRSRRSPRPPAARQGRGQARTREPAASSVRLFQRRIDDLRRERGPAPPDPLTFTAPDAADTGADPSRGHRNRRTRSPHPAIRSTSGSRPAAGCCCAARTEPGNRRC